MYGEANRSDDGHYKDSLSLTVPKKRGHAMPCGATRGSTTVIQETEEMKEKHGQKPLLCFFCGKKWARLGKLS